MSRRAQCIPIALIIFIILQTLLLVCCSRLTDATIHQQDDIPTFTLSNNITIPLIGLGGCGGTVYEHFKSAINVGYRYIDTAQSYSWGYKEEDVGRAVHEAKLRYQDNIDDYVYVQTKIHPQDLGYKSTQKAIQLSLDRLQVTSLDSMLLHKPRCWEGICNKKPEGNWQDSWVALEEAMYSGIVRSIGICDVDYNILDELLQQRIWPTTIQNWYDPFHQDKGLRQRIKEHNEQHPQHKILYQGYSTLGNQWNMKGFNENPVLNNPALQSIAKKHGASVPQVVIQWATREGVMVLPASRNASHQKSNLNSYFFTLSDDDMRAIDDLDGTAKPKTRDPNEVQLQFVNQLERQLVVYWVPPDSSNDSDHVHVGELKATGDVLKLTSYHGHTFVFKTNTRILTQHVVDKALGVDQNHGIDISEEL